MRADTLQPARQHCGNTIETVGSRDVELFLELLDHRCIEVDEDTDEMVGGNLDAERRCCLPDDLQQERRAPAAGRRPLGDADEAPVDQLPGDRGDRRRAEPETARDRGARNRAGVTDQAEDRDAVEIAAEARGAGPVAHAGAP